MTIMIDHIRKICFPNFDKAHDTFSITAELKQLQEDIVKAQTQQPNLTNTPLWAFKALLSILIKHHFKSSLYENQNNRY